MTRTIRTLFAVIAVAFALSAAACADATGPSHGCDTSSSNTCK
jgi:hypothetical protein